MQAFNSGDVIGGEVKFSEMNKILQVLYLVNVVAVQIEDLQVKEEGQVTQF